MVRLTCKSAKCNHVWLENKKQRASEHVFCPKCNDLHHSHTPPINPPKTIIINEESAKEAKKRMVKSPQINPAETFSLRQLGVIDMKTKGVALGYRTKEIEK